MIKDNVSDEEWRGFVFKNDGCCIFHSPEWENLLKKEYGFEIKRICETDKNGEIIAGIQVCVLKDRIVSLPFSDYYGIVIIDEVLLEKKENKNNLTEKNIIDYVIDKMKVSNAEIKSLVSDDRFVKHQEAVVHFGYYDECFDDVSKGFAEMHKRGVKKALKAGLEVKINMSMEGMKKYYALHLMTRKRQGIPVQPYSFFENLHSEVIDRGLGFTALVYKDDALLSGGIFLHYNNIFTYKYGASDIKYLDTRPNNLLFHEMIKYAIENGYNIFDFGKTDMVNNGLRKFKSGWGAVEKPLFYSYYPKYKSNKLFAFAKDKIVSPMIKYSPDVVCKGIGKMFYKYTV